MEPHLFCTARGEQSIHDHLHHLDGGLELHHVMAVLFVQDGHDLGRAILAQQQDSLLHSVASFCLSLHSPQSGLGIPVTHKR